MRPSVEHKVRLSLVAVALCVVRAHGESAEQLPLKTRTNNRGSSSHACLPPFEHKPWCNSTLPLARRSELLVAEFTLGELISQMSGDMAAIPRLGVPKYHYGYEALRGVVGNCPFSDRCFTSFPCSSAAVQSFNRTCWHATGVAQNSEARAMNNAGRGGDGSTSTAPGLHMRGPQLNPQRDPRWGRNAESPGEDAWLNGEYGVQIVRGGQGATVDGRYPGKFRKAINEMKHFTAYSVEEWRDSLWDTANISLRDLSDYYFTPLRMTIQRAEVGAFMCAYDAINGTGSCGNRWMNNEVVRKAWGWNGVIESDCGAISGLGDNPGQFHNRVDGHLNAPNLYGAAVLGVNATVDMQCDVAYSNTNLVRAVNGSVLTKAQLQSAVNRTFFGRFRTGEFDSDTADAHLKEWRSLGNETVFSKAHQDLAMESARQSIVMLRNAGNLLPLRAGEHIAVVGPNGNASDVFFGQYHGAVCPGEPTDGSHTVPHRDFGFDCLPSAFDAIRDANIGGKTTFNDACKSQSTLDWWNATGTPAPDVDCTVTSFECPTIGPQACRELVPSALSATLAAAKVADVVILVLGLNAKITNMEGQDREHDETGFALPGEQVALARKIAALGKPTIAVVLSGMAVGMDFLAAQASAQNSTTDPWSIVVPGYGARFGARALAEMLFGKFSPSGRLAYTVYPERWAADTPMTDMSLQAGQGRTYKWFTGEPTFPFGAGMSYTKFSIDLQPHVANDSNSVAHSNTKFRGLRYSATVTNIGAFAGAEVVLVFARAVQLEQETSELRADVPIKQLCAFDRTPVLPPGANHTLSLTILEEDLALTGWDGRRVVLPGKYRLEFEGSGEATVRTTDMTIKERTLIDPPLPTPFPSEFRGSSH